MEHRASLLAFLYLCVKSDKNASELEEVNTCNTFQCNKSPLAESLKHKHQGKGRGQGIHVYDDLLCNKIYIQLFFRDAIAFHIDIGVWRREVRVTNMK